MMKRFITVLILIFLPLMLLAQSANLLSAARGELDKRGLTEAEVRTRLLADGIDVDAIPPTQYTQYQGRIINILNQLQAEKAQAANAAAVVAAPVPDLVQTSLGEAAAEASLADTIEKNNVSLTEGDDIYGHSLFTGQSLDVFRTTDGAEAPDTYVLGEGDEVHISIFGSSQTEIHQRIGPDGSIQPAGATKIFLKGMTLGQARNAIRSKLAQHYSFRQDQIAVTLSTARTIFVSIYGEVGVQGGFTLSALNTAFNALAAAGGPTAIGSVREIRLSRDGKAYSLDLYKYMKGYVSGDHYDLQHGDVLFVPVAKKIVRVEGAVNRPMRYEMQEEETLVDLIDYAGGLSVNAQVNFVQVERYENGESKYYEYDLSKILTGSQKVSLVRGDVVRIRANQEPLEDYVAISGDVYYEGQYDLALNSRLSILLENAKPRYTAKTDFLIVERTRPDETVEVLSVPFPGVKGQPDFVLQSRDHVRVLELADYRDIATIGVAGQVRKPFTRAFGINDRMSVSQAIDLAGGLLPSVFPVAYIVRTDLTNRDKRSYIAIQLEKDGDRLLQPGDQLTVYDNTTYTNIGEVRISGAVKNPLGVAYDSSLTLHDLIMMAGGFDLGAAYNKVEVFRVNISRTEEVAYDLIRLSVDEAYNPQETSFQLQPFDHVVVRRTPNFATGRTVEINGRVRYPGVYVLEDSRTQLSEVINMAGGLQDDASPYATIIRTYRNRGPIGLNLNDMNSNQRKINADPILMEGDVVNIVREENTVTIRTTGTRMNQYVPEEYVSGEKTVVYQGAHSALWYINHYAGGFDKYADRRSVTVTMPNNQTEGTKTFIFRSYPKVQPGSVITLRMDQDKIDDRNRKMEEPKNKVDLESVAAKTLAAATSVLSIYILARNAVNVSK